MVIYGLVIIVVNRLIDLIILECICGPACLKLLGSGVEHLEEGIPAKKLKDSVSCVGGALDGTLNDYCLNLEGDQQDASNVLNVLKESTFQMENRISEEVVKRKAVKFYLSLQANFHLSTDVTFLTNPPAVLNTDTVDVYSSSDVHSALNSIYGNLGSAIEDFQQRGSGWI